MCTPQNTTSIKSGHAQHHLLSLPAEVRLLIYEAVFEHHVCPIQRKPITVQCNISKCSLKIQRNPMRHHASIIPETCSHQECVTTQQSILRSDPYTGLASRIASQDYPCPQDLDRKPMNLSFLLTCRLIYNEARHLPYMRTVFFTQEVGSFSNFTFCLQRWQVQSIQYLNIRVPPEQGMDTHLAEWNETFSLISLGFSNLAAISLQIYLRFPIQTVRDTFWDGGLLELCRLKRLRGMRLSIFEFDPAWPATRDPVLFFTYAAGSLPDFMDETTDENKQLPSAFPPLQTPQHICFRRARDKLRDRVQQDTSISKEWTSPESYHSGRLFFRFAPNVFPLYVRSLIHSLPSRWPHRTHADVRREDRLHNNKTDYAYVYTNTASDPEHSRYPIFGFQFNPNLKLLHNEEYVAQGLAALRLSRERLLRALASDSSSSSSSSSSSLWHRQRDDDVGDARRSSRSSVPQERKEEPRLAKSETIVPALSPRRWITSTVIPQDSPSRRAVASSAENERPGDWRRQLTEEAFAPFIESFPIALW